MLAQCGMGFGAVGLATLLGSAGIMTPAARGAELTNPMAPRFPHFRPRAKRVVHFFLHGGPPRRASPAPKPMLEKYAGKPVPGGNPKTERKTGGALPTSFKFAPRGRSGL